MAGTIRVSALPAWTHDWLVRMMPAQMRLASVGPSRFDPCSGLRPTSAALDTQTRHHKTRPLLEDLSFRTLARNAPSIGHRNRAARCGGDVPLISSNPFEASHANFLARRRKGGKHSNANESCNQKLTEPGAKRNLQLAEIQPRRKHGDHVGPHLPL